MPVRTLEEIADSTLENLFTNGMGDKAQRLVLLVDGRDYGGWGRPAVRERLVAALREAVAPKDAEIARLRECLEGVMSGDERVAQERAALREWVESRKTDRKADCDIWTLELLTTWIDAREKSIADAEALLREWSGK